MRVLVVEKNTEYQDGARRFFAGNGAEVDFAIDFSSYRKGLYEFRPDGVITCMYFPLDRGSPDIGLGRKVVKKLRESDAREMMAEEFEAAVGRYTELDDELCGMVRRFAYRTFDRDGYMPPDRNMLISRLLLCLERGDRKSNADLAKGTLGKFSDYKSGFDCTGCHDDFKSSGHSKNICTGCYAEMERRMEEDPERQPLAVLVADNYGNGNGHVWKPVVILTSMGAADSMDGPTIRLRKYIKSRKWRIHETQPDGGNSKKGVPPWREAFIGLEMDMLEHYRIKPTPTPTPEPMPENRIKG